LKKIAANFSRIPADFAKSIESAGKVPLSQNPQQNPHEYLRIYFCRKIVNF
jgi:hypothetical protein